MSSFYPAFKARFGPWALITGASSGIGRALAEGIAARGLNVVLVARREAELRRLAAELESHHRIATRVSVADLSEPTATEALVTDAADLDIGLVVAAAGFGTSGPFLQSSLAQERNMLALNAQALLELTHLMLPRLVQRGRGGIILPGSIVGFQGTPWAAHYAATKAYVQTLAEGLHQELKPQGINVLALAPGPVHSGFADRAGMRMAQALRPEQVVDETLSALATGRMTVRPGWLTKVLSAGLATAPRSLRVRIMQQVMGGMTAHRR